MQTVTLDLSRKNIIPPVHAKQGDVGRKFKVVLTDAGVAYTVPRGAQFSLWFSGPSGEGNYSAIGENNAFVVEGNTVVVEIITQMLNNVGTCSMCLVLTGADGSQLGLWNMVVVVEAVPGLGSAAAEQYYTALSEVAEKAVKAAETFQTDTTMTVSGRAADAATVGVMLEGKAPAGYGLGGFAKRLTSANDLNNVTAFGVYGWNTTACPSNAPMVSHSYMIVKPWYSEGSLTQEVYVIGYGEIRRVCLVGTWDEWEWVNPPMHEDVEYRTTERWNGKAVYTKLLNIGALPNAGFMDVDCNTTGATEVVTYNITTKSNTDASFTNTAMVAFVTGTYASIHNGNIEIGITTDRDASHLEAKILIKYTKD